MKMGQPGVPKIGEYLETALAEGENVGFDGRVVSVTEGEEYEKIASEKNGKVVYAYDLIDEVWEDRPILQKSRYLNWNRNTQERLWRASLHVHVQQ